MRAFTDTDYEIVSLAMRRLPLLQRRLIHLRFWNKLMIHEIAGSLGLQVPAVERELSQAFTTLRNECLSQRRFSRHPLTQTVAA